MQKQINKTKTFIIKELKKCPLDYWVQRFGFIVARVGKNRFMLSTVGPSPDMTAEQLATFIQEN
jgi:hypothetical protein